MSLLPLLEAFEHLVNAAHGHRQVITWVDLVILWSSLFVINFGARSRSFYDRSCSLLFSDLFKSFVLKWGRHCSFLPIHVELKTRFISAIAFYVLLLLIFYNCCQARAARGGFERMAL